MHGLAKSEQLDYLPNHNFYQYHHQSVAYIFSDNQIIVFGRLTCGGCRTTWILSVDDFQAGY